MCGQIDRSRRGVCERDRAVCRRDAKGPVRWQTLTVVLPVTPRESVPAGHSVHTLLPALLPAALKVLAGQAVSRTMQQQSRTTFQGNAHRALVGPDDAPVQVSPAPVLKLPGAHGTHAALLVLPMAPVVSVPGAHGVHVAVPVLLANVLIGQTVRRETRCDTGCRGKTV